MAISDKLFIGTLGMHFNVELACGSLGEEQLSTTLVMAI
jgi:hypothetical protein